MGFLALLLGGTAVGCAGDQRMSETEQSHRIELANLENLDDLDFNVYSGQKWDQLGSQSCQGYCRALAGRSYDERHQAAQRLRRVALA
jgi:hypothetical protein